MMVFASIFCSYRKTDYLSANGNSSFLFAAHSSKFSAWNETFSARVTLVITWQAPFASPHDCNTEQDEKRNFYSVYEFCESLIDISVATSLAEYVKEAPRSKYRAFTSVAHILRWKNQQNLMISRCCFAEDKIRNVAMYITHVQIHSARCTLHDHALIAVVVVVCLNLP